MIYLSDRTIEVPKFGTINLFSLMEGSKVDVARKKRLFVMMGVSAETVPFGFVGVVYRVNPCERMERDALYKCKVEGVLYRDVRGEYSLKDKKVFLARESVTPHEEWVRAELSKSGKAKRGGVSSKTRTATGAKRGKK